jgi:hypothetical protein
MLIKTHYKIDPEDLGRGTATLEVASDLTDRYNSCKGIMAPDGRHLLLLSNEQTLYVLDLSQESLVLLYEHIGKYELVGQSNVRMFPVRGSNNLFLVISLKYQLFKLSAIPPHLVQTEGPTMRIECLREMISMEY